MDDDTPWLSEAEQAVWRRWLAVERLLPAGLARDLVPTGLSLADFEVLVGLTEAPDGRLRVGDLAERTQWERSRLSHQVRRMQGRGLVERRECEEDRRGAYVQVTAAGRAAIEAAAPAHVRSVRRRFLDALSADEVAALDVMLAKIADAGATG